MRTIRYSTKRLGTVVLGLSFYALSIVQCVSQTSDSVLVPRAALESLESAIQGVAEAMKTIMAAVQDQATDTSRAPVKCNPLHEVMPDPTAPPSPDATSADAKNAFDSSKLAQLSPDRKHLLLTSGLPCAEIVTPKGPKPLTAIENLQRGFDFYSWLTFLALNTPAKGPTGIENASGGEQAVWENGQTFKPLLDVMLPGGAKPFWEKQVIPPACQALHVAHPDRMVVKMIEESYNQPFKTGPLIDQHNNYAIFDILMNKAMFEYIVKHDLFSQQGQKGAANSALRIDFPPGQNKDPKSTDPNNKDDVGSIMIKVSWKILEGEDNKSKFHHIDALMAMPATPDEQFDPPCLEKTLGLVGIHIVHKTIGRPQWIWTSFEHADNVPELSEIDNHTLKSSYNFYDRSCDAATCPPNETPPRPWDPEPQNQLKFRLRDNGKVLFNSQIVRELPLTPATKAINEQFHAVLSNSVWKNYILIGTQWPSASPCTGDQAQAANAPFPFTDFDKQPDMNCAPAPTFLANSTLETFSQGTIPQASSSCMACHGNATSYLQRPAAKDARDQNDLHRTAMGQSDFTFMLEKAR